MIFCLAGLFAAQGCSYREMSEPERLAIGGKIATVDIRTGDKTILAAEPGQGGPARTVVAVGAALCCEEAIAA
ncbi:hypothetical protein SB765_28260, partial [Pseudomonas sp. SIMBA_067]